jgi:uncharacterized protein (TIGR00730 family)
MEKSPIQQIMEIATEDYITSKAKLIKGGLHKGIVAFGSARISEEDPHLKEIVEISKLCAERVKAKSKPVSFITGGGPSVMTAWLKGAYNVGDVQTSGIVLPLPHETPEQQFQNANKEVSVSTKTFQARKALMFEYARALIVFKGGFGTMDELFYGLTLMKTKKIPEIPVFIYPANFYGGTLNFDEFIKAGTIKKEEEGILHFINNKEELLEKLYKIIDEAK